MTRTMMISLLGLTLAAGMAMANCGTGGCGPTRCATMDSDVERATAGPPPAVCAMLPFTPATHYMSLEGYARLQHFQQTQQWTPKPAVAHEVHAQLAQCPLDLESYGVMDDMDW